MWPFGHRNASPETEPELTPALKRRLEDLEEKNRLTEKQLNGLQLDWSEWFNKFRLLYARLTKRVNDEQKREQDDPGPTIGAQKDPRDELVHHKLTPPVNGQRVRRNY